MTDDQILMAMVVESQSISNIYVLGLSVHWKKQELLDAIKKLNPSANKARQVAKVDEQKALLIEKCIPHAFIDQFIDDTTKTKSDIYPENMASQLAEIYEVLQKGTWAVELRSKHKLTDHKKVKSGTIYTR